jgi:NADPH:quinone reductase-like Zn-dependent oxidoreductase
MGSPREYRALINHVTNANWKPIVDHVYRLDEIDQAAMRLSDPDRFGKVVLRIG